MATRATVDTAEQRAHQHTPVHQPPPGQIGARATDLPEDHGWKNEEGPAFFKFEKVGDTLAGELMDVREVQLGGKPAKQYTMDLGNGLVKFNGTFAIQEKLGAHHIGKLVRVRYLGDDVALGTNQNPLRLFQVQTKDKPKQNNPDVKREDVPF